VSWETLTYGEIDFKKGTKQKEREKIIKKVKDALELPSSKDFSWGAYNENKNKEMFWFICVNWSSHTDEEKIKNLLKELKGKIEDASITLHYLNPEDDGEIFTLEDV
jgi:hypothetical protein